MNKHSLAFAALILALVAPMAFGNPHASHAKAHAKQTPQQMFQSLYHKMDLAMRDYNVNDALAYYSPQLTVNDPNDSSEPTSNFTQARRNTIRFLHLERFLNCSTEITSVTPVGDGTYFIGATTVMTMKEPIGQTGRFEDRVLQEADQDYWDKEGGHWMIRKEVVLGNHIWINGKQTM